jgi:anti-sigma factor RsiW
MACAETARVEAWLDGERDAAGALAMETHVKVCAECAAARDRVLASRHNLAQAPYYRASDALRRRIARDLAAESAPGFLDRLRSASADRLLVGALSGALATAAAAAIAFFTLVPPAGNELMDQVMAAHLRSLMPGHLIDVASSDHHTVRPWFNGHTDVAPPVADFAKQGFTLVGGRVDYVYGERAAAIVYREGHHVINVFVWADKDMDLPSRADRNGYHLRVWREGDLVFCEISDAAPEDLARLQRLVMAEKA